MLLSTLFLAGCSSLKPWQNVAATPDAAVKDALSITPSGRTDSPSIVAALTLSGGGARAAAFGLGVLRELKASRFVWEGKESTLLDQVDLISGVSGGSILAAHYALFGDETLDRFETEFLMGDFEVGLLREVFSPSRLFDLTSPWYGRSHILEERLRSLYRERRFADLAMRSKGPRLLITATDLTTGAPFEFTSEQFSLICSDLAEVPVSFAVAASSAVPLILSPLTLRNHAGECASGTDTGRQSASGAGGYRGRMLKSSAESYVNVRERPYLHLVDGGLADNLGLRGLLDRIVEDGSIRDSFRDRPPGSVRKLILIAVNSERDLAERIDQSDQVPSSGQVVEALLFGAGARATQMTLAMLEDDLQRWKDELIHYRGKGDSPFAPDAEIHVVSVSLRDVPDPDVRSQILRIPTAFSIAPTDVRLLEESAKAALRQSSAFQQLRSALDIR